MFELIALVIAILAGIVGFRASRRYVRTRLRFVDAVQSAGAPWIAGLVAALFAAPVVLLLPVVGAGTAIALGIGVAAGVARGAKDVRLAGYQLESPVSPI